MEPVSPNCWDAAADEFQRTFLLGQNAYHASLLRYWEEQGMLRPGCRVLDIGCGVGKYGVFLAQRGCDVTLLDFSPEMLRRAAENMAPFSTPWRTVCLDFTKAHGDEPVFAGGFDLSISTMSPAVCDAASVRTMSAVTRGWCFLARFADWKQPLRDEVLRRSGEEPPAHGKALAEDCEAMLRAVREAGYEPQLRYADYNWADLRTPEELAALLLRRSPELRCGEETLVGAARSLGAAGVVNDAVYASVAWISWKP